MATVEMKIVMEITDDATTGPDYGNDKLTPEFLGEYMMGAEEHLFGRGMGAKIVKFDIL